MGLFTRVIERSKTGLDIEKGVLIRCCRTDGNVDLPDNVEKVYADAFKGCEEVRIDRSEEYISSELDNLISKCMHDLKDDFLPGGMQCNGLTQDFYGVQYYHLIKVWGMEASEIEKLLPENSATLDASKIPTVSRTPGYAKMLMNDKDFGILLIKNLTKENVDALPPNFMYNLVKTHLFGKEELSRKWIVILQGERRINLDEPGDIGMGFDASWYKNIEPKRYLQEMECAGKIITESMLWDAYFKQAR